MKRLAWADEVGRNLIEVNRYHNEEEVTLAASSKGFDRDHKDGVNEGQQSGKLRILPRDAKRGGRYRAEGGDINSCFLASGSYKEVWLRKPRLQPPASTHQHNLKPYSLRSKDPSSHSKVKRCWCIASDHRVAVCRDPVKWFRCLKIGHRALSCKEKVDRINVEMNRVYCQRGRMPHSKVYVPYTEE